MSRLDELIEELCPDGVEYKPLWEVTIWDKKFNAVERYKQKKVYTYPYMLASDLFKLERKEGDVYLLSTGEKTGWTTEDLAGDNLCKGEVVAIPWGGTPNVKYYNGKFVTADNRIATSIDTTVLCNKFLYYWMQNNIDTIASFYRGSGIKHPNMKNILDMEIPLPPLPVQQEIVRILDNFTELITEIESEIKLRKKQYDYYRDSLLSREELNKLCPDGVEYKKIKQVYKRLKGTPITAGKMKEIDNPYGEIRIFAGGKTVINAMEKDIPNVNITRVPAVLVQSRGVIDAVYYDKPFTFKNEMWAYTDDNTIAVKYLYYVLKNNLSHFRKTASSMGSLPQISLPDTEEFVIPLPPLPVQQEIVRILDNFTELIEELTAELEARQKQYEYYRDKLLSFKEVSS
ncbi:restriction endonuclease subunit S [Soehngenia longivitae]|uniref:Restriction endonuclease subunit S n=1 Tax=Soehngenia longivitae TaxID=2562294 RepID=A0A4Z0D302_9FIRM|nr:restriction endonuclease subunit S [Soehngenia longivitae]TFZ39705.1 restriction endonuclease subunit S [Soehngenia longivitae]